jgi:hypothetical protein
MIGIITILVLHRSLIFHRYHRLSPKKYTLTKLTPLTICLPAQSHIQGVYPSSVTIISPLFSIIHLINTQHILYLFLCLNIPPTFHNPSHFRIACSNIRWHHDCFQFKHTSPLFIVLQSPPFSFINKATQINTIVKIV